LAETLATEGEAADADADTADPELDRDTVLVPFDTVNGETVVEVEALLVFLLATVLA
jgi:hypothetical protein